MLQSSSVRVRRRRRRLGIIIKHSNKIFMLFFFYLLLLTTTTIRTRKTLFITEVSCFLHVVASPTTTGSNRNLNNRGSSSSYNTRRQEKMEAMSSSTTTTSSSSSSNVSPRPRPPPLTKKELPDKLLIGYTYNNCNDPNHSLDKVTKAIKDGVNVLIWSFIQFDTTTMMTTNNDDDEEEDCDKDDDNDTSSTSCTANNNNNDNNNNRHHRHLYIKGGPNIELFLKYKQKLIDMGYSNVIHLVAFGGWNGPHFPSGYTGRELYDVWNKYNTDPKNNNIRIFDGVDWDFEGEDNVNGNKNYFTKELLNQIVDFSIIGKKEGKYIISMAPAESYLDITTSKFSRYVNLTYDNDDNWHTDFTYHGWNIYAYILAKCNNYNDNNDNDNNNEDDKDEDDNNIFDFIQIQFYESYSHAAYQINKLGMKPSDFLVQYISQLLNNNDVSSSSSSSTTARARRSGYMVNFKDYDPSIGIDNQFINIPISSKLVWGFANGWARNTNNEKHVYFPPEEIQIAYNKLRNIDGNNGKNELQPRGMMFWVIEEEGKDGLYYANELGKILFKTKNNSNNNNNNMQIQSKTAEEK